MQEQQFALRAAEAQKPLVPLPENSDGLPARWSQSPAQISEALARGCDIRPPVRNFPLRPSVIVLGPATAPPAQ